MVRLFSSCSMSARLELTDRASFSLVAAQITRLQPEQTGHASVHERMI